MKKPKSSLFLRKKASSFFIRFLLALIFVWTAALYAQVISHSFVLYDVYDYILNNDMVKRGLSLAGIRWSFKALETGDWQPLTWISWMTDCTLFGLRAGFHHLMNALFHSANSVLLFLFLYQCTRAPWRSLAVSLLFAVHPLHVESVAWAAGRKDTLSTFFFLLALISYTQFYRPLKLGKVSKAKQAKIAGGGGRFGHYLLAIFFYALGLMSKPMLVTFPFVLLLLDYWPLEIHRQTKQNQPQSFFFNFARRLYQKIPFFILSLASCWMAIRANDYAGGIMPTDEFPVLARIANALAAYVHYLGKMFWPKKLIFFYPHPGTSIGIWESLGAFSLLTGISWAVIRMTKKYPYLLTGWLWYLGTLIPVIGLVQVGSQAMADRYTYIPLTGIFITMVWGLRDLYFAYKPFRKAPWVLGIGWASVLLVLSGFSYQQIGYWKDDKTLYDRALKLNSNNYAAHGNLGFYYELRGEWTDASYHYQRSLHEKPGQVDMMNNLGTVYLSQGETEAAKNQFEEVLKRNPRHFKALFNLGLIYSQKKEYDEAKIYLKRAIEIDPYHFKGLMALANVYVMRQEKTSAEETILRALKINPQSEDANYIAGNLAVQQEDFDKAKIYYARVLKMNPANARSAHNLASIYFYEKDFSEAIRYYQKTLEADPNFVTARINLGKTYARTEDWEKAAEQFKAALSQSPDYSEAQKLLEEATKALQSKGHNMSSYYLKNL